MNSKNKKDQNPDVSGESKPQEVEKDSKKTVGKSASKIKNSKVGSINPAKSIDGIPPKMDKSVVSDKKKTILKKRDVRDGVKSAQYRSRDIVPDANEDWYSNVKKSPAKSRAGEHGGASETSSRTQSAKSGKYNQSTTPERPSRKPTWDKSGQNPVSDRPTHKPSWNKSDRTKASDKPVRKSSWDKSDQNTGSDNPHRKSSWEKSTQSTKADNPTMKSSWDKSESNTSSDRPSRKSTWDKSEHSSPSAKSTPRSRDQFDDDDAYPRRSAYISKKETGIFEHESMSAKDNSWRLNKYIANSGICSRREADAIIAEGKVKVNGKVVTEMGIKVTTKDRVTVDGSEINPEDFIYILLNKPKNYITTTDDEKDRATVMDLIKDATGLRVYPVGRLDRNTTGLLVLTNDGDLANRLMHPKYKVKKTYEVETAKPMHDDELNELLRGITLEDGEAKAHDVERSYADPNVIQISIFEGRNRQVRRMIEHFRHEVVKLHRTYYAGLNVKGVRQGRWRFLKSKEVKDLRILVKLFDLKQK
jgi:23S rRNA pseudouridine2605 synthase